MQNRDAEKVLDDHGLCNSKKIVEILISTGFIEDTPISDPERLADGATKWLSNTGLPSPKRVFEMASGWSTDSWTIVMDGEKFDNPMTIRNIFRALLILANRAGEDLSDI